MAAMMRTSWANMMDTSWQPPLSDTHKRLCPLLWYCFVSCVLLLPFLILMQFSSFLAFSARAGDGSGWWNFDQGWSKR
jgi:hypothetical protein